jgi:hypothetical protein
MFPVISRILLHRGVRATIISLWPADVRRSTAGGFTESATFADVRNPADAEKFAEEDCIEKSGEYDGDGEK